MLALYSSFDFLSAKKKTFNATIINQSFVGKVFDNKAGPETVLITSIHRGGMNEVSTKTSLLSLIALSGALLTGCIYTTGSSSRAIRIADEQCASTESKMRQLQSELKLAEQRAAREKQRREFAEERLKKLEAKTEKPGALEKDARHGS
jgi:outer membrane murein-binding lipoprotein Lpp